MRKSFLRAAIENWMPASLSRAKVSLDSFRSRTPQFTSSKKWNLSSTQSPDFGALRRNPTDWLIDGAFRCTLQFEEQRLDEDSGRAGLPGISEKRFAGWLDRAVLLAC